MGEILSYSQFLKTYKTRGYRLKHLENYKSLFPIKSSPRLAGIVADLIGDGHLQGNPKWRIDFTSKEISELKRFEKEMNFIFNVTGKVRKCTSNRYNTYNLAINSSPIARILFLCGVPAGQKVLIPFKIPDWIKNDKECFRIFCRRLFTCEGSINYEVGRTPRINLEMWKSEKLINDGQKFIESLSTLMNEYLGIISTVKVQSKKNKRKDGIITQPIRQYICAQSTRAFYNKIGFEGNKQQSLKALLSK